MLATVEPRTIEEMLVVAELFAKSGLFRDVTSQAQAFVKILAGRELGFGAFMSMNGVHVINGKVVLGAHLIAAAIKRHPSPRYDYQVIEHTDAVCRIRFTKDGEMIGESSFSMQDAAAAELLNKSERRGNWEKFPRNMLFARALSNGARWYCPDVFGGAVYTPDELGAEVDEDGNAIVVSPHMPEPTPKPLVDENRREERRLTAKNAPSSDHPPALASTSDVEDTLQALGGARSTEPPAQPGEGHSTPTLAAYDPGTDTRPLTPRTWEQLQAWLQSWPQHPFANAYAVVNAMRTSLAEAGLIDDRNIPWPALYGKNIPVCEVFRAIEAHYAASDELPDAV